MVKGGIFISKIKTICIVFRYVDANIWWTFCFEKNTWYYIEANVIVIYKKLSIGKEIELNRLTPSTVIREPIDVDDILRKTTELCMPSEDSLEQMKKTMATLAIKNTFLELGLEEFDKIVLML